MLGKESRFVEGMALGMWQANCFILGDVDLGTAVVVDPGQNGGPVVKERLAARGVRCEALLLTHGHLDHIWAVPELARDLDAPVLLH
jgi:hydroxyacylglutathione hydrolase